MQSNQTFISEQTLWRNFAMFDAMCIVLPAWRLVIDGSQPPFFST